MFAPSCLRRNSVDKRTNRHPRAKGFCALTAALALPVRTGNISAQMIDFETVSLYDALGRRIGIDDSGTQTWTVYNGGSADANPYTDFTGAGSLKMRYLDGLAVDELLSQADSSGNIAWYLTDNLGSVTDVVNTSGTDLDHIVYDPYGNIVTQTNATNAVRFGFAGMEYDSVTGLYYDHARYYDPVTGRFMSQDPAGFAAGDTDLYRYVANGPTDATDPSGLIDYPVAKVWNPATDPGSGHVGYDPGKIVIGPTVPPNKILILSEKSNKLYRIATPPINGPDPVYPGDGIYGPPNLIQGNPGGVVKVPDGHTAFVSYDPAQGGLIWHVFPNSTQAGAGAFGGPVRATDPSNPKSPERGWPINPFWFWRAVEG